MMNEKNKGDKDDWHSIIHELRTQLTSIELGTSGIRDYLPRLLDGYRAAVDEKLVPDEIRSDHLRLLSEVLANNESTTLKAKSNVEKMATQLNKLLEKR